MSILTTELEAQVTVMVEMLAKTTAANKVTDVQEGSFKPSLAANAANSVLLTD